MRAELILPALLTKGLWLAAARALESGSIPLKAAWTPKFPPNFPQHEKFFWWPIKLFSEIGAPNFSSPRSFPPFPCAPSPPASPALFSTPSSQTLPLAPGAPPDAQQMWLPVGLSHGTHIAREGLTPGLNSQTCKL